MTKNNKGATHLIYDILTEPKDKLATVRTNIYPNIFCNLLYLFFSWWNVNVLNLRNVCHGIEF